ncbi:MAG: inositol monophosphatase family protein [Acidimicrobiia bacterium]
MHPESLLALFAETAGEVAAALRPLTADDRRARTDRPGQYHLDTVADAAALSVLGRASVRVLSEESGWTGPEASPVIVVIDPVDGSTNASRGIPYWATSLCAVDGDGPLAALVVNQATGVTTTAVRGHGAWRDGRPVRPAKVERLEDAVVALSGRPAHWLAWRQFRALGSAALSLCDLAAGVIEGVVDAGPHHAPWDYLGGLLACTEAGAAVAEAGGKPLYDLGFDVRRQLVAAANPVLLEQLLPAVTPA